MSKSGLWSWPRITLNIDNYLQGNTKTSSNLPLSSNCLQKLKTKNLEANAKKLNTKLTKQLIQFKKRKLNLQAYGPAQKIRNNFFQMVLAVTKSKWKNKMLRLRCLPNHWYNSSCSAMMRPKLLSDMIKNWFIKIMNVLDTSSNHQSASLWINFLRTTKLKSSANARPLIF